MSITDVVARTGIIDQSIYAELRKWGHPIAEPPSADLITDPNAAIVAIQEAIESEEQVEVRTTDLDIFRQYMKTLKKGQLHLVAENGKTGNFETFFGRMKHDDGYIIPWRSSSVEDLLTNGKTYLLDGRRKIYFSSVQEYYYGGVKAFMVCTPAAKGGAHDSEES